MNRANRLGMAWHQALGFHRLTSVVPGGEAVFWPGCALLKLEPALLEKVLAILRREEPDIRLAAACCGQPTRYLFPQKESRRREALAARLKKQGVQRIYTACPNCRIELARLEGVEILPVWPALAKHLTVDDIRPVAGDYIWHDPCPTRNDPETQAACRTLLALSGQPIAQPEHTGPQTLCCGSVGMLQTRDPEKSRQLRRKRLEELGDRTVVSGCEGCVDAFRMEGRTALHLLELLFGESRSRSFGNRCRTIQKAKR